MLLHLLQQFYDCEEDWYAGGAKSRFGRCQANAPGPEWHACGAGMCNLFLQYLVNFQNFEGCISMGGFLCQLWLWNWFPKPLQCSMNTAHFGLQYPIKDLPCLKHLSAYEPHFLSPCSCLCDPKPFKSSGQICHGEKVIKPSVLHPRNNSLKFISVLVSSQMGKIDLSATLNLLKSQILINPHFIYVIYMLKNV